MPKFTDTQTTIVTPNNYRFTATDITQLGACEYTLVTIICDVSSSVYGYANELEECIKTVLDSCHNSPRAANLMLRLCAFNQELSELHGFKELSAIDRNDYINILNIGGSTALYEASFEGIDAADRYGAALTGQGYSVNGIVFIITDGEDNSSKRKPGQIKKLLATSRREEHLESMTTVLVGVTQDTGLSGYLKRFRNYAGLDHYLCLGNASKDALAGLAGFMSRSISMVSTSLGSGQMGNVIPLKI